MKNLKDSDFADIQNRCKVGIWKLDVENGIPVRMYVDSVMAQLLGVSEDMTPEECCKYYTACIHPDDYHLMHDYMINMVDDETEISYRYLHPEHGEVQVRCWGRLLKKDGDTFTFGGYHRELVDVIRIGDESKFKNLLVRKNRSLQQEQDRTEEYIKNLMDRAACGIISYALPNHDKIYMNAEALRIFGIDDMECATPSIVKIIRHTVYQNRANLQKLLALRKNDGVVDYECTIKNTAGKSYSLLAHTEMIKNPLGERIVYTTFWDISENVALKNEKNILDALSRDYVFVIWCDLEADSLVLLKPYQIVNPEDRTERDEELESKFLDLANAYSSKIKYYFDSFVNKNSSPDFLDKLDANFLKEYLPKHDGRYSFRCRIIPNYTGSEHLEVQVIQLKNSDGFKVVMGFRQIDDILRDEEEQRKNLEEAVIAAKRANIAKSTFLFNMSHDIRTPMNAIVGYTELLQKSLGDKEKSIDYISKIQYSSEFLLALVNNVLEMARIESGKVTLDEKPLAVGLVLDKIVSVYEGAMKKKNIAFERCCDIKNKYIYCDDLKIKEVMLNLVSNAYKYTPAGGCVRLVTKELPCEIPDHARFSTSVIDTGIGISKEYLPLLFDEFSRERNSMGNRIEGTGLGMAIVKRLVDLMGGTIQVESELGQGSTFTVTFTHRIACAEDVENGKCSSVDTELFVNRRILLAEDNDLNAEIVTEILKDYGIKIERVRDGAECVDKMRTALPDDFDLILMDVQMPNMNGYQATHAIRNMQDSVKRNVPIVAMTANAFEEDKRNALIAGMNAHIAKPIHVESLLCELSKILKTNDGEKN